MKSLLLSVMFIFVFVYVSFAETNLQSYLFKTDKLYIYVSEISQKVKDKVNLACLGYREAGGRGGFREAVEIMSCAQAISMIYPTSNYNPATGGYVAFGNTIVYLTALPAEVTKVVVQEDYVVNVIKNPLQPSAYTVTVQVPGGGNAQFLLGEHGILDIQGISTIFDIERALLKQNIRISQKRLVRELLEYYQMLRRVKTVSSLDFILSLLSSVREQEKFIEFVLQGDKQ